MRGTLFPLSFRFPCIMMLRGTSAQPVRIVCPSSEPVSAGDRAGDSRGHGGLFDQAADGAEHGLAVLRRSGHQRLVGRIGTGAIGLGAGGVSGGGFLSAEPCRVAGVWMG